ncbi:MAG: DUF4091 domain-containing protein [Lentisphaeria bacterium]|nr:DUF4091 domain-containing protein [Lentisphaeria bacterium]
MLQAESKTVSSLEKVFCSPVFSGAVLQEITALRGERINFQIAVRCEESAAVEIIPEVPEGFCGKITLREVWNIPSLMPCAPEDDYTIRKEPGLFPDALVPIPKVVAVSARNWHAVWVSADVPADAVPGRFLLRFKILFTPRSMLNVAFVEPEAECEETIAVTIVNARLPEQKLKVTHWFYADCIQHHYRTAAWSEKHWQLLEKYFRNYAEHQNNLLLTPLWSVPLDILPGVTSRPVCQLLEVSRRDGVWNFDFSRLERWIVTAQKCGIRNFEMVHAFSQWGLKYAPEIIVDGRPMFGCAVSSRDPEYAGFLRALMKAMLPVLRNHGLTPENCYFHISDEPGEADLENYRYASCLFREILEDYPVIDALSSLRFFRQGLIERPVPNVDELDDFIRENTAERWVYYAGSWKDNLPGRQFGMPSLRARILGVLLYVYGCDGFLEWGYNFWFGQFNRTWDVDPWVDSNCERSFRSGGAYIVYPGEDGPVDSLRHEVLAEGFRDEMALRQLESRTSRDAVLQWLDEEAGYRLSVRRYPKDEKWLLGLRDKLNRKLAELGC